MWLIGFRITMCKSCWRHQYTNFNVTYLITSSNSKIYTCKYVDYQSIGGLHSLKWKSNVHITCVHTEWYQDHKWTSKGLSRKSTSNVCKYKWRVHRGVYEAHSLEETHVLYIIFSCRYETRSLCIDPQNSLSPPLHNHQFSFPALNPKPYFYKQHKLQSIPVTYVIEDA